MVLASNVTVQLLVTIASAEISDHIARASRIAGLVTASERNGKTSAYSIFADLPVVH